MTREGEKQELWLFQRESPPGESQAAFHQDKKSYYVTNNGDDFAIRLSCIIWTWKDTVYFCRKMPKLFYAV